MRMAHQTEQTPALAAVRPGLTINAVMIDNDRHRRLREQILTFKQDAERRDVDALPWLAGAGTGRLGHGWNNTVFVGYSPSPRLTVLLEGDHQPSRGYDRFMLLGGLQFAPRPDWRLAPFLEIGTGLARVSANAVYQGDPPTGRRSVGYYGAGLRWAVNNRFELRLQERSYLLSHPSSAHTPNEALNEWKAGFAFYF
mgnify:CR=1 FL=1